MVKLSDRLERIVNLIDENETMADIGTDHGFLPVALWERGICKKIILSDVNKGPLEKAMANSELSNPGIRFDLRLGDGLKTLAFGEVTTVVIAGMGGVLMIDILGADLDKSKSFKKIILQPRNGQGKLRHWLMEKGFEILVEDLVREGKTICEILVIGPGENTWMPKSNNSDIQYELPALPLIQTNILIEPFVKNKIRIEKKIIEKIITGEKQTNLSSREKVSRAQERIKFMEAYLKEVEKKDEYEVY